MMDKKACGCSEVEVSLLGARLMHKDNLNCNAAAYKDFLYNWLFKTFGQQFGGQPKKKKL